MIRKAIYSKVEITNSHDWDFHEANTQTHLHSLHPYPARFIPQIPHKAISKWSKQGDTVLDPFCGCGTTLLESALAGRPSIGVDNNAVACLVSRAKTANYSKSDFKELEAFEGDLRKIIASVTLDYTWKPDYENMGYWFDPQAIDELSLIRESINNLSEKAQLFALAIFSSIVVRVSYQESDTKYRRRYQEYKNETAFNLFHSKLRDMIGRLSEVIDITKASCQVHLHDSRQLGFIQDDSVKLIVTSPPYLNAYDYHKYHRHRLQWIDGDIHLARDFEIGKHDTFTRKGATPDRYFQDMKKCFEEWMRILLPGGKVLVVIGDAIVSGEPVTVGDNFIEICKNTGFHFEKRWKRKLLRTRKSFHRNARIDEEHILLFNK